MFKKILIFVVLIGVLSAGFAFAGNSSVTTTTTTTTVEKGLLKSNSQYVEPLYGMVVKFEGSDIVTNLGETKNIKPGTKFYVYRVKTFIGVIQVFEVSNWTSLARVISTEKGEIINRGDRLSDKELIFVDDMVYVKGATVESTTEKSNTDSNNNAAPSSYKVPKVTNIEDIFKKHARFASFKQKGQPKKVAQTNQINVLGAPDVEIPTTMGYSGNSLIYNRYGVGLMDVLQLAPWVSLFTNNTYNNSIYRNNWPLYSTLGFAALTRMETIQQREKFMGTMAGANIMVVKWDESMAYEIASLMAYKEAVTDQNKIKIVAENIIKDRKINEYLVFEVRIQSTESLMVQFAPWNYHMYLVDSGGNRVKIKNYSITLDKGVSKGQQIVGYVYFDKSYDSGKVKISLENMLGADSTMTF